MDSPLATPHMFNGGHALVAPYDCFGDATAADVAAGKTFTSAAGLKVAGTKEESTLTLQTKTATPQTSEQVITPDSGYDGLSSVVVEGDSNLVAENIKEGISIFGVTGSLVASSGGGYASGDVVKAAATSATLLSGWTTTSIVYGDKVTASDGTVALSGLTTTLSISDASSFDDVKGKYVKTSSGSIYYIPSDATITQSGTTYSKTYTADKANLMFVLA